MHENYYYLGLIALMFPRAVVIHCRRDPRDVALSCWLTNFNRSPGPTISITLPPASRNIAD